MKKNHFPSGWDEPRVKRVLKHYETQSDEAAVAEDEAAFEATKFTAMEVPVDLVPKVRQLIARRPRRLGRRNLFVVAPGRKAALAALKKS